MDRQAPTEQQPLVVTLAQLFQAITFPFAFLVFALFWLLVYDYSDGPVLYKEIGVHGVNFGMVLLDLTISLQHYPFLSATYSALYGIAYIIWSIIFDVSGMRTQCSCPDDDTNGCIEKGKGDWDDRCHFLYGNLNWRDPVPTIIFICFLLLLILPLISFAFWYITTAKRANNERPHIPASITDGETESKFRANCCGWTALCAEFKSCRGLSLKVNDWRTAYGVSYIACLQGRPYLALRALMFLVMLVTMLWSIPSERGIWIIWLSNTTLVCLVFYLGFALGATYLALQEDSKSIQGSAVNECEEDGQL